MMQIREVILYLAKHLPSDEPHPDQHFPVGHNSETLIKVLLLPSCLKYDILTAAAGIVKIGFKILNRPPPSLEILGNISQLQPSFDHSIAVLVPCYNEEAAIAQVVKDFRSALPSATVYVYDNNSKDRTKEMAAESGAVVRNAQLQGKGNVVCRMFADVEADIYVLVDGDDTYDAASAEKMVKLLVDQQLDMINGRRVSYVHEAYRRGHKFGNALLTKLISLIFGRRFTDIMSGYRVFSRRFVKSFPALSSGFEIETELTVHALELRMPTLEVDTPYKERPKGSVSKLNTYKDGWRILVTIFLLMKEERPMQFFGAIFLALATLSVLISAPIFITYFQTGLVPRLPTAVLASGILLVGFLSLVCGFVLDTVTLGRREAKRMRYLDIPPPGSKS